MGLVLPLRIEAIWLAARPSTLSLTSTTSHARFTSAGFALYVLFDIWGHSGTGGVPPGKDGRCRGLAAPSQADGGGVPWSRALRFRKKPCSASPGGPGAGAVVSDTSRTSAGMSARKRDGVRGTSRPRRSL